MRTPLLASLASLAVLAALALAPASARAADLGRVELTLDEGDHRVGLLATPAFASSGAFMAWTALESGRTHWFDRGWAIAELATGIAGSAYSGWVLAGAIEDERGESLPIASWTAGAALAMNLRLVTHAALSWALWDEGADPMVRGLVPSITISPLEGGAMVALRWTL